MAKVTKPKSEPTQTIPWWKSLTEWQFTSQHQFILGVVLMLFSISLLIAFVSFFLYGNEDQTSIAYFFTREDKAENWLGKTGAWLANFFIFDGFGAAAFIFVRAFFLTGLYLILDIKIDKLKSLWFWDL